jgi:hypothetical protein
MYSLRGARSLCIGVMLVLAVSVSLVGQGVVINEIAWAGTAAQSTDEWIELYNPTDEVIDLDGWTLVFGDTVIHLGDVDGATVEIRRSIVEPNGFFLLERTDDTCVSDIEADVIYRGSLSNQGVALYLLDPSGATIDTANLEGTAWPAGSAADGAPAYASMERVLLTGGDRPENWGTNDGIIRCGKDANEGPVNGTPRMKNATTVALESYPCVEFLAPQAEMTLAGIVEIAWSATDPDGAAEGLRIDLHLTMDEGETWESLAEGLANGGAYQWDTTDHPDGQNCRLKITATDQEGHVGEAVSPEFIIANAG